VIRPIHAHCSDAHRVLCRLLCCAVLQVGEVYKLHNLTIHMSIAYLDRILGAQAVAKNRLQLVALCCMLTAAKYEELEDCVPTLDELNECCNGAYTSAMIKDMEVNVLTALQWHLGVTTPFHFLSFFLHEGITQLSHTHTHCTAAFVCALLILRAHPSFAGVLFEEDLVDRKPVSDRAVRYVREYCQFFNDLCLQGIMLRGTAVCVPSDSYADHCGVRVRVCISLTVCAEYSFQQYLPSVLACAVVGAARTAIRVEPVWRAELSSLSRHSAADVFAAYRHLYTYYEQTFPVQATGSGVRAPRTLSEFLSALDGPSAAAGGAAAAGAGGGGATPMTGLTGAGAGASVSSAALSAAGGVTSPGAGSTAGPSPMSASQSSCESPMSMPSPSAPLQQPQSPSSTASAAAASAAAAAAALSPPSLAGLSMCSPPPPAYA
jgi:hypothetical protein